MPETSVDLSNIWGKQPVDPPAPVAPTSNSTDLSSIWGAKESPQTPAITPTEKPSSTDLSSIWGGGESRPNNGQPAVAEAPPQHLYQDSTQPWYHRAWDWANTPLSETLLGLPETRPGAGGFERGAEKLISGFTSPLSVALTAATFGTGGLIESAGATALKEAGLSAAEIADAAKGSEAALQAFKAQKDIEPVIQSALEAGGHDLGLLQRAKEATSNLVPDTNFGEPAVQNVLEKAGFSEADRTALAKASDTVSEARAGFKPIEDAVRDAGVDVDKWKQAQDILYKNGLTEQDLLGGNMVERGAFQILRKAVPTLPVAATARAAKTANAVLNAGFTYQQLEMAAQMSPRFLDALKEGDYDHAWEYGTEAVAGGAFGLLGAPHALHAAGELFKPLIENESFRPNDHWLAIDRANKEREAQHAVAEQHAINIDQHARELLGHEGPRPIIGDTAEVQGQKADELAATHLWRDVGQGSPETAAAWHDALAEAAGSEDRVGTQIPNVRNDGGGEGQAPPGTPIAPDEVPPRANTTVLHSNAAGEVRVGADGRPVVWLAPEAWDHFNSAVEPENAIKGVSYSPDEADRISNALAKIAPGQEIEDLFQEAQRASKQNLLTATASPEKLGTDTAIRVVSEELHHTWQRELSKDGDVANHLNPEGFTRLRGIIPEAWTKQQDEYGYDKDPIVRVVETAAQFMAGRAGDHVSVSDQARWLGEYFREVEAKHGKESLNSLDNINEIARQHVEDINARKAAADRTTEERANRGRVSGVQERPAGVGGLGQAEPGLASREVAEEPDLRRVYHWSRKPAFTETNPELEGTGVRGAGTNRQFIPGTYFGEENYREPMVQGNANKYSANLDYNKIYDRNADPLGLTQQARDLARKNGDSPEFNLEKLIQQNGFEGYRAQGVIKYFKPVPVVPFSAEAPGLFSRENSDWTGIKKYLTPEELTKHDTPEKQNSLVAAFNSLPNAEEWHAAVQAGRAGQMWYERSSRAFDALLDSGFERLHPQDKDKFLDFVAALSPVQPVKTNLLMALEQWTKWDKAGRPTDVVWKDGKPNKSSKLYQMMRKGVDLQSRLGNAIRALQGEPLSGPKVSSFTKNLGTDTSRVTNDTWMAVLAGQDPGRINKPATYDAMSAKIREAAEAHGIAPRQAQAAAWSFIKSLAELSGWGNDRWIPPQEIIKQGLLTPDLVAAHSADFADLLQNDPQIRGLISKLGGDINAFDEKFKSYVPERPAQGEAAGVSDRLLGAAGRLEAARANAGIQRHLEAKSGPQSSFDFQRASDFNPAFMDEHTGAGTGIGAKYMPLYARERQPNEDVDRLASAYTASQGINKPAHEGLAPVDTGLSKRVADAYEAMKHSPERPKTKAAYEALKTETKAQWDAAEKAGYKFEPWTKPGQPYANSAEMAADVRDNKHLYYFQGGDLLPDHPMSEVDPKTGETYNNIFRALHDLFGHAKNDYEFGPRGEENAFLAHSRMYSDKAVPALLSETKGQNSWVNFGPHLRDENGNVPARGEKGYVPPTERPYGEQKAGLLPDNLVKESVRPNNGLFSRDENRAPQWYLKSSQLVDSRMQGPMPADTVLKMLENNGVKPDELKYTGLDEFLRSKGKEAVRPEEVRNYLAANNLQVQEVTKGGAYETYGGQSTKFGTYTLPGGQNYREMLLTLPELGSIGHSMKGEPLYDYGKEPFTSSHWDEPNVVGHVRFNDRTGPNGEKLLHLEELQSDWHQKGRTQGYAVNSENIPLKATKQPDGYWEVRRGDTDRFVTNVINPDVTEAQAIQEARRRLREEPQSVRQSVPDAPFKKTWPELLMKRMVRYAAEHGYDGVSWTPGEEQAARYDLSKSVNYVHYLPDTKTLSAYDLSMRRVLHEEGVSPEKISDYLGKEAARKLLETEKDEYGKHELAGEELKVGGEGMKGFYDKIVPELANKLGKQFGAKVGETKIAVPPDRLKSIASYEGPTLTQEQVRQAANSRSANATVNTQARNVDEEMAQGRTFSEAMSLHGSDTLANYFGGKMVRPTEITNKSVPYFPITDSMRESVLKQGQPLFARGPNNGQLPSNIDDMIRDNKFKTLPKEYQDRVLGALKKLATGQMSDRETAAAKYLAQEQDKNYEIGSANDLLHNYLEDYMTRVYKDANPEGRVILSNAKQGKFATNVNMARQRVYESTLTALLKSPKEMLLDPVSVTAQGRAQLIKAAANRQLIDKLRDNFTRASDGRPAVVLSGQGQVVAGQNGEDPKTFISPDRVRKINIADAAVQSMQKSGDLQRFLDEGTIKDITPYVRPNNINAAIDRLETQSQSKEAQYDQVGNNKLRTQIMYLKSMLNNKDFSGLKDFNDQLDKKYAWDPQDYISLDNGAMKGWNFVTNDSAGNGVLVKSDIRVHPEFAQYLKDRLGLEPSAIAKNPIGKALLGAGTKLKHTLLSLSPFHMVQIALRGVMTGVNPFTLNGPDILNGAKVDPTDPNSPTKMYKIVEQGMTTGTDHRALQEHSEGVSAGGNSLRLIPGVGKTIANSLDSYQDFLFKRYIPAIKATAAEHMFDEYQRLHPEWSTDKIAKMAGQHANDSFGGINWKAMGRSATTQDWGRLMLLAPDWLESEMRSGARLFNGEEGGLGRAQVAKMALGLWGIARVLNYVTTGSFHNEAPFGLVHKNKDGKEIAYGIRTLPTDLLHAASDPVGFIKGRLSPSIRMGQELLTQRDQFGRKLAPSDMWADVFHNLSPIPLQSLGQAVSGTGPEIGNTGQIVKALGGTAQTYQSPAQKMAADLASNHTEDGPIDPSKMARHRRVMQLEDQARNGQVSWPDLMKLTYQTDQLGEQELKTIEKNVKATQGMDPAVASLYTRASRLPAKEFLQLWDVMNPLEKAKLSPLMSQVQKRYLNKAKKEMTPTERQSDPVFQRFIRMIPNAAPGPQSSNAAPQIPQPIQQEAAYLYTATHPETGHRVASNDGQHWVDHQTGEPVNA